MPELCRDEGLQVDEFIRSASLAIGAAYELGVHQGGRGMRFALSDQLSVRVCFVMARRVAVRSTGQRAYRFERMDWI